MEIINLRQQHTKEIIKISKSLSKWFTKSGKRNIRRACKKQNGLVAFEKSKIIGFLLYRKWKKTAEITWMGVLPEYQRKGIGKSLMEKLENKLRKDGIKKLKISTLSPTVRYKPYEKTRKFYSKMGFEKYKIDKKFYPDGSDRMVVLKEVN